MQADYGAALADNQVDLERVKFYAGELSEFDTFDGVIRGPVSVWEAAATVLGPMRAEPARIANTWSINRDEPRAFKSMSSRGGRSCAARRPPRSRSRAMTARPT
jgi:hypothetical protein